MSEFIVTLNGKKKKIVMLDENRISIDDKIVEYKLTSLNSHTFLLKIENTIINLSAKKLDGNSFSIYTNGRNIETIVRSALQEKAIRILEQSSKAASHKTEVKAPMPGMILKIKKNVGDNVVQGDSIIILEAMKMENDLRAPATGIIKNVMVKEGSPVEKGTVLFSIE